MSSEFIKKSVLCVIGTLGTVVFLSVFALTFYVPEWMEDYAASYIETKAQEKLDGYIDAIQPPDGDGALSKLARTVYDKNEQSIEQLRSRIKDGVHEKWAASIVAVRNLDCDCRTRWEDMIEGSFLSSMSWFESVNERVSSFIHSGYMQVVTDLKRDIRIFTGGNAVAFLLLLLLSWVKPRAATHLFLPGILLAIATLVCSYFYLFQQNWLLTIIQGSYVGYAYLAWLGVVYVFLCDIAFNHGQLTCEVINGFFQGIGSALTVAPC